MKQRKKTTPLDKSPAEKRALQELGDEFSQSFGDPRFDWEEVEALLLPHSQNSSSVRQMLNAFPALKKKAEGLY